MKAVFVIKVAKYVDCIGVGFGGDNGRIAGEGESGSVEAEVSSANHVSTAPRCTIESMDVGYEYSGLDTAWETDARACTTLKTINVPRKTSKKIRCTRWHIASLASGMDQLSEELQMSNIIFPFSADFAPHLEAIGSSAVRFEVG